MQTLLRQNDTMIAVETASAVVDFADILEATKVIPDECSDTTPWEHCSGFEHEVETAHRCNQHDALDIQNMQGYCYCEGYREFVLITLPDGDYGLYDWQRARGATRQVAREAVAAEHRRILAQLVEWYSNGWQWCGVRCDFSILGQDFDASIWGIDDNDYAEREVVDEIASEVADLLEAAGFTVTDRPEKASYPNRESKRTRIRYNLNIQNWKE